MTYSYEIESRADDVGGGWRLRLLEDGVEVGGGVFPADGDANPHAGMDWWNGVTEVERAYWLDQASSAKPRDAWAAYLRQSAHDDAIAEAEEWIATRAPAH